MNETIKENKMIQEYPVFAIASLLYAVFYTLCLYQNHSGITFPVFTAGTVCYFGFCLKRLHIDMKKDSMVYLAGIELLGISTCLTGDERIITMNKFAIFLLLISFLLHTCYDDRKWDFSKYTGAVFTTVILFLGCLIRPVTDMQLYQKSRQKEAERKRNQVIYILLGLVICIPLVVIVLMLLNGADAVFAECLEAVFGGRSFGETFWNIMQMLLLTVFVFFFSYMLVSYMNQKTIREEVKDKATGEPLTAITVTAVLSVIYLLFCGIQILYLFIGGATGVLTLPKGITYSDYARHGFFQLLFVCMLNLGIVLIGIYRFRESRVLKTFLCILTGCTYIMIASSALRMILYIQYQYLTFLRIFVLWALFVIALIMTGVVISIIKKDFPLFRYSMFVMMICYLVFSFSRPDYFIAKVNTDNMKKETQYAFFADSPVYKDNEFLAYELCSDAAPVIMTSDARKEYCNYKGDTDSYGVPAKWRSIYIKRMDEVTSDMDLRSWNLSRYIAKSRLK